METVPGLQYIVISLLTGLSPPIGKKYLIRDNLFIWPYHSLITAYNGGISRGGPPHPSGLPSSSHRIGRLSLMSHRRGPSFAMYLTFVRLAAQTPTSRILQRLQWLRSDALLQLRLFWIVLKKRLKLFYLLCQTDQLPGGPEKLRALGLRRPPPLCREIINRFRF